MNKPAAGKQCDECGRKITKAHRVYKGHRYCSACYKRVFKPRLCPKCGNFARLPKNDATAVCKKCESDKPCIRCGREVYSTGKVTPYGPACNSCAPYFREPRPCGWCGRLSTRLSRNNRLGIDVPICPKCARRDHGNCAACRRRRLLQKAPDGRHLCRLCLEKGEVDCQTCGNPMPAGRGKICETCYWNNLLRKRIEIDKAAFTTSGMREHFSQFGEWLLNEVGGLRAATSIHKYLSFFMELEERWDRIPGYMDLLNHFGADGLRRVGSPMRWLKEKHGVIPDIKARENDSEHRRMENLINSIKPKTAAARALIGYRDKLMQRVEAGRTKIRSVRLALRPALSLLLSVDETGTTLPDQSALDRFLLHTPGQKAALTGFINYLHEQYGLKYELRIDEKKVKERHRRQLEKKLIALMRAPWTDAKTQQKWIVAAMEYFHRVKVSRKLMVEDIKPVTDGLAVTLQGKEFFLPTLKTAEERLDSERPE